MKYHLSSFSYSFISLLYTSWQYSTDTWAIIRFTFWEQFTGIRVRKKLGCASGSEYSLKISAMETGVGRRC